MEIIYDPNCTLPLQKRTYLPVVLRDTCPLCGGIAERDLMESYFSYPEVARSFRPRFHHECPEGTPIPEGKRSAFASWEGPPVVIRLTLELAPEPEEEAP